MDFIKSIPDKVGNGLKKVQKSAGMKDLDFDMAFDQLTEAKFWSCVFKTFLGTAAWVIIAAVAGGSPWAWGVAYAAVSTAFIDNLNALDRFRGFLDGNVKFGLFVYALLVQAAGAAFAVSAKNALGLEGDITAVGAYSFENWLSRDFWLCREVVALVFYFWISSRASGHDIPEAFFRIILIALAFIIGGEGFAFFPAHAFVAGFDAFFTASAWTLVFLQLFAVWFSGFLMNLLTCE